MNEFNKLHVTPESFTFQKPLRIHRIHQRRFQHHHHIFAQIFRHISLLVKKSDSPEVSFTLLNPNYAFNMDLMTLHPKKTCTDLWEARTLTSKLQIHLLILAWSSNTTNSATMGYHTRPPMWGTKAYNTDNIISQIPHNS